jgi:hypothetical protein
MYNDWHDKTKPSAHLTDEKNTCAHRSTKTMTDRANQLNANVYQ